MSDNAQLTGLCDRFRGFYPVVIDVETAGFNAKTDALLEIAAITLKMDEQGWLMPDTTLHFHVEPFVGANLQPEALAFNGIDPNDPDRGAVSEYEALHEIFKVVRKGIKASGCNRAIMVAHNANFDHSFMMAAAERASLKRNPFHPFATFAYVDILQNPDIRAELPKYANWPTFPQLWVDGELVGGCDIVIEMYQRGELQQLIKETAAKYKSEEPDAE